MCPVSTRRGAETIAPRRRVASPGARDAAERRRRDRRVRWPRPRVPRARRPGRSQGSDGRDRRCDRHRIPSPQCPPSLVQAVLKGDKMDGVVRDATMAGVARIVPVVTERSLRRPGRARTRARARALAARRGRVRQAVPPRAAARHRAAAAVSRLAGRRRSRDAACLLVEPSSDAADVQPMRAALAGPRPWPSPASSGPKGDGRQLSALPPSAPAARSPASDR